MIGRNRHRHPPAVERRGNRNDAAGNEAELRPGAGRLAPPDFLPMTTLGTPIALSKGPSSASSGDRRIARHGHRHPTETNRRGNRNDAAGNESELRLDAGRLAPPDFLPMTTVGTPIAHSKRQTSASSGDRMIARHGRRHPSKQIMRGCRNDEAGNETELRPGAGRLATLDIFLMTDPAERMARIDRPVRTARSGRYMPPIGWTPSIIAAAARRYRQPTAGSGHS